MPRIPCFSALICLLCVVAVGSGSQDARAEDQPKIRGIVEPNPNLPAGMSFWALLDAEASDAAAHAGFAVNHPTNLENIQRHTRHVRHLVDPAAEPERPMPGREHGVAPTAQAMIERLASDGRGLDPAVRRVVDDALRNAVTLSDRILENCAAIVAATSAEDAIAPARANQALLVALRNGGADERPGLTYVKMALGALD